MLLSDKQIHTLLEKGDLLIVAPRPDNPFNAAAQVRPASIDLRLDTRISWLRPPDDVFDVRRNPEEFTEVRYLQLGEEIAVPPGAIVFGQLYEQLKLPEGVAGMITGRSRTARAGLSVHATGDFINPGFEGAMPLQIVNHTSFTIVIYPLITICQLILFETSSSPDIPYGQRVGTQYQSEGEVSSSVLYKDPIFRGTENRDSLNDEKERRLVAGYRERQKRDSEAMAKEGPGPDGTPADTPQGSTNIFMGPVGNYIGGSITNSEIGRIQSHIGDLAGTPGSEQFRAAVEEIMGHIAQHQTALGGGPTQDAFQQLDEITRQAALEPSKRSSAGVIKGIVAGLGATLSTVQAIEPIWQKWAPTIRSFFGF
jgi:dCTP deaminase